MADSEHLKDFKAVWADTCQSMWAEILALSIAESYVVSSYSSIPADRLLTDMFYVPKLRSRLGDLRKDNFLSRVPRYNQSVITNRLVILSACFETYLSSFLDAFIQSKPKYWDQTAKCRTAEGDKFYGEVVKVRGLGQRILRFGELAPSKIKSVESRLSILDDVYVLRNVLAHRAGLLDEKDVARLKHVTFSAGERVSITTDQLLELATPVIQIAEILDQKL